MQNDLASKSKAINLIKDAAQDTSIILDFDETLLLRNSTAEYINSLRPRLIGFILVSILKVFRPWVWLPQPFRGDKIRDWFLIIIPTILLPWSLLLWQKKAQKLAQNYGNLELIEAVKQNCDSPIIIASLGFNFVINPILKHLPIRYDRLVGCRLWRTSDRHQGKLLMMRSVLSDSQIHSAIVVTDSEDDIALLQVVAHPCLLVWSLAKYIDPFSDFWLFSLLKEIKK